MNTLYDHTQNLLLCCDWGTSFFRLKLANSMQGRVMEEIVLPEGIAAVHNASKELDVASRKAFFFKKLKTSVDALAAKTGTNLDRTDIVISGMASSSIGLKELPYANLPFHINGKNAIAERIKEPASIPNDILLISGVSSNDDVMRGEETEMIGISAWLNKVYVGESICIFPGTHSKHLHIQNENLVDFKTYMTGEIFRLMMQHSIIGQSVSLPPDKKHPAPENILVFNAGVQKSMTSELSNALFSVRVNHLKKRFNNFQNYYYLSGLLIGSELKKIRSQHNTKIILCGASNISRLYQLALQELSLLNNTIVVPEDIIDTSAMQGQILIHKNRGKI